MRRVGAGVAVALGIAAVIQLVPYGRDHANPPVMREPEWGDARTRELFFAVCGDCHSNETTWPWYSAIAPASWLMQRAVDEARSHFNVSEWGRAHNHGDEAVDRVQDGEMPPWYYPLIQPRARLSAADREALVAGLGATFGERDGGPAHDHDDHDDHDHSEHAH